MRFIAMLILPSLAIAAPALKQLSKPEVEVKLVAKNQHVLEIVIRNEGRVPLELPFRVNALELLVVELEGEKGKTYKIRHDDDDSPSTPGKLTIPAGESKTLTLHSCHFLHEVAEPGEKVIFRARLQFQDKTYDSKPLTVDP